MKRGESAGGGHSSLGYLFGTENKQKNKAPPPPPPSPAAKPPYGTDLDIDPKPPGSPQVSNNYHRAQGPNSGNFITGRPSTKVKSPPGGDSSVGYLFGDK